MHTDKIISRTFLLIIVVALLAQSGSASNAIVTVVITTPNRGLQAFGTGFVASNTGDVITCYHVIEGATAIRVIYKNKPYDAQAIAIAPDRDIARLHMQGVPLPTEYLETRYDLPTNIVGSRLTVEGFAAGLYNSTVDAHATQNSFVLTREMSGIENERLFASENVKVIPITLVIYRGMSGAPLISPDGKVLGIVSGSLSQGGQLHGP